MSGIQESQKSESARSANHRIGIAPKKKNLTQARLKELLDYEPKTGRFIWKDNNGWVKKGDVAGKNTRLGYIEIMIKGHVYLAHRLVWLYIYGYLPENDIDHIDKKPGNNRLNNLREVSRQCNMRNRKLNLNSTSGVKGVYWKKQKSKWAAWIGVSGKVRHLGYHEDFCEAVYHRLAAEQCLDWSDCDSSSPAYQYVRKQKKIQKELDRKAIRKARKKALTNE